MAKFDSRFGALLECDAELLTKALTILMERNKENKIISFLEIGVQGGGTARGIKSILESNGYALDYTGIDSGRDGCTAPPFDGAKMYITESENPPDLTGQEFDLVFIDGCHCFQHALADFYNYSGYVKDGFIMFHDTAPCVQNYDFKNMHEVDSVKASHVRYALENLGIIGLITQNTIWECCGDAYYTDPELHRWPDGSLWGGMVIIERKPERR